MNIDSEEQETGTEQEQVAAARSFKSDTWKREWINPPAQCTGSCKIQDGVAFRSCKTCGWNDY